MISQVTFWVEHGESTDPLEQFIANAESEADYDGEVSVIATDFIVDVPNPGCSCGTADLGAPGHDHK